MRVLITGMCGFIGHHLAEYLLEQTDWDLVGIDRIDATSTAHRLREIPNWKQHSSRVKFVWHDLRAELNEFLLRTVGDVDVVIHMASSAHVDRSIADPRGFVMDNVLGACNVLLAAKEWKPKLTIMIGTDEVFGPAPVGVKYKEFDRFNSTNPYAATKAGAEELGCAFSNCYGMKVFATHTMNVFGERQHWEKFIPGTLRKLLRGERVIIHGDETKTKSGSRFWIHAQSVSFALRWLIEHMSEFPQYDKFNIVGEHEITNLELAQRIAKIAGKTLDHEIVSFHDTRPGHDMRYAMDGSKLQGLGCLYPMTYEEELKRTVNWFLANKDWIAC